MATSSSASSATYSTSSFPVGSRVTLRDLSRKEYNGMTGIVKSGLSASTGRQQVRIDAVGDDDGDGRGSKTFALKPSNLTYVPRSAASLNVREMKAVLRRRGVEEEEWSGMDKSQLAKLVRESVGEGEEGVAVAAALAEANAPLSTSAASTKAGEMGGVTGGGMGGMGAASSAPDDLRAQADAVSSMSPSQLRQQASMMKSMPPSQIRAMNPQMANMSDAQIRMTAQQMEMMANNPGMMKMAAEQMKNMSPEEMERVRRQAAGMGLGGVGGRGGAVPAAPAGYGTVNAVAPGGPSSAAPASPSNPPSMAEMTPDQLRSQADQLSSMSPSQLRSQAATLKSMPPSQLRLMNPQMAGMSDAQIRAAADQMEMMADNPDMMKMAAEQMKGMSPEDVEKLRRAQEQMMRGGAGGAGGGGDSGGAPDLSNMDPTDILKNMDAKQIKASLEMLKKNPEMVKQMMGSTPAAANMSEEQLQKGIEAFADMDEAQIERAMGWLSRAQRVFGPVRRVWGAVDGWCGGHLRKMVLFAAVYGLVRWAAGYFFGGGGDDAATSAASSAAAGLGGLMKDAGQEADMAGVDDQDEFGGEF